jgi:hypothetical protein
MPWPKGVTVVAVCANPSYFPAHFVAAFHSLKAASREQKNLLGLVRYTLSPIK